MIQEGNTPDERQVGRDLGIFLMLQFDSSPKYQNVPGPQRLESKVNNCQWSFYSSLMLQESVTLGEMQARPGSPRNSYRPSALYSLIKINTFKAYRKLSEGQSSESIFLPLNEEKACLWICAVDSRFLPKPG